MSINGVRSQSADAIYIRELERVIKDLTERIGRLEQDRNYLFQKGTK